MSGRFETRYFRLMVVTPIHIGSGESYSPFDYVVDGGWMHLLDRDRFLDALDATGAHEEDGVCVSDDTDTDADADTDTDSDTDTDGDTDVDSDSDTDSDSDSGSDSGSGSIADSPERVGGAAPGPSAKP